MTTYFKTKTIKDKKYLDWLKTQPCSNPGCRNEPIEGVRDIVYAHQNLGYGYMGGKCDDQNAVPLCVPCHSKEHNGRETFWGDVDIKAIIYKLWTKYLSELETKK